MWHSKETVAEKNGARLVVWNGTSKRRKRESEGNEIILREKRRITWGDLLSKSLNLEQNPLTKLKTELCVKTENQISIPIAMGVLQSRIYYGRATRIPGTFNRIKALSRFAKTNEEEKKGRGKKGKKEKKEKINHLDVAFHLAFLR